MKDVSLEGMYTFYHNDWMGRAIVSTAIANDAAALIKNGAWGDVHSIVNVSACPEVA